MAIVLVAAAIAAAAAPPALAGPPPTSCTPAAGNGCNLESDILIFGETLGAYLIQGRVTSCLACFPGPGGSTLVDGRGEVVFSYDGTLCAPAQGIAPLAFKSNLKSGPLVGSEKSYVPYDAAEIFPSTPPAPLRATCTSAAKLDYRIPKVLFSGGGGAKTDGFAQPTAARIYPPDLVRAWEGGAPVASVALDTFPFTQAIVLSGGELRGAASTLRFGPDGLPFRLGPRQLTFDETSFRFTAPGTGGGGPAAYEPILPDGSAQTGLTAVQVRSCAAFDATLPCTVTAVGNAGYLFDPTWTVDGTSTFTKEGLTARLLLPAVSFMRYETYFPQRLQVALQGPGRVDLAASRITGGEFTSGEVLADIDRGPCPGDGGKRRRHALRTGANRPRLGVDGALLAGIETFAANLWPGGPSNIPWTYNAASVTCGTLHVPEVATAGVPVAAWYDSAVPTVRGRGVYAGLNYNRTRACRSAQGALLDKLCTTDAQCDVAAGETCADAGHAPYCDPGGGTPLWTNTLEGHAFAYFMTPGDPTYPGREMAFVLRRSGVTGVFDSGEASRSFGTPASGEFAFELARVGLGFKTSRSERGDTITRGRLLLPWPADTDVPFEEMEVCDCGRMDSGRTPRIALERDLGYWGDQTFFPYGLSFTSQNNPDCTQPAATACGTETSSTKACIESVMPVPRFAPEITGAFDVAPAGQVGKLVPWSVPRLDFDADDDPAAGGTQAPWRYDLEKFTFSDWNAAGSPSKFDVLPPLGHDDFGYIASNGDLALPFFGLTAAGLKVERERFAPSNVLADAHTECDETLSPLCAEQTALPYVVAQREIAKATVPLPYRLDYMPPEATSDPNDGTNQVRRGRGSFYGFAHASEFDLGSAKVASALVLRPNELVTQDADLGPAAAMRLWGSTLPAERARLNSIFPAGHDAWGAEYDAALAALGYSGAQGHALPPPPVLAEAMLTSGAIGALAAHPDASTVFNTEGVAPGLSPPTNGTLVTGYADIEPDLSRVSFLELVSNTDTGGEFYQYDGQVLTIDRHVKENEEPITSVTQRETAGGRDSLEVSDGQRVKFPKGGSSSSLADAGTDDDSDSPLTLDWDFDMPGFQFRSLTGTLDLMNGGLSGMGFDKLGATFKFYADGDWYFTAGMAGTFSDYRVKGDVLTGNTTDMKPLRDIDPMVSRFLKGVDRFDGIYIGGGFGGPIWNYGCLFRVSVGVDVAGWYITDSYGGKLSGWVAGTGACIVSVRGQLTLIGGEVNNKFRVSGNFWAAGGIGFCEPEEWDTPSKVLDDDWCAACVGEVEVQGTYPPKDFDLTIVGPEFECSL